MGRTSSANGNQGSKWIRPAKRLAIYARDAFECVYCGASGKPTTILNPRGGAALTLDHLQPRELGGSNEASNLVTACCSCNSARRALTVAAFARIVAAEGGYPEEELRRRIVNAQRRDWLRHLPEAKRLNDDPPRWLELLRTLSSREVRPCIGASPYVTTDPDPDADIPF